MGMGSGTGKQRGAVGMGGTEERGQTELIGTKIRGEFYQTTLVRKTSNPLCFVITLTQKPTSSDHN